MTASFVAPGPGQWALDRSHYPEATTPISEWLLTETMAAGTGRVFGELGAPIRCVRAGFVNGFMYTRVTPLIGAERPSTRLPPKFVLRAVSHLHPEFRRRARRAKMTMSGRGSLDVADDWKRSMRPSLRAANLAFQQVQPADLDDADLQTHISALLDHLRTTFELHFWLHGHDLGPIARFLHSSIELGLDPEHSISALAGASPTTAIPADRLFRLRAVVDQHAGAVESLDDVRAVSATARELLDEHLDHHGHIVTTGYDLTALTLNELPQLVMSSIRSATEPIDTDPDVVASPLRSQLPADRREEWDRLLQDARSVMDMRDDNGPLTVEWPIGLLRRALLTAGHRLVARASLLEPEHALELTHEEARSIFDGSFDREAIAERAARRRATGELDPPQLLGPDEPEPPLDVLPAPLPTLVAMIQTVMRYMGMDGTSTSGQLTGAGVGSTRYTGRARTARTADDAIEKLEPGDVLIVRATSPAFNAVLAIAGAVVTADGGAMSHAAVLARELGISAVVGASGALDIADGSTVEVDPIAGVVRVINGPMPPG
jgi:pyruvate,water dikinase